MVTFLYLKKILKEKEEDNIDAIIHIPLLCIVDFIIVIGIFDSLKNYL